MRTLIHIFIHTTLSSLKIFSINVRIILLENSRSTVVPVGIIQDILEPIVTPNAQGCKWNVDVPGIAASVGLHPADSRETFLGMLFQGSFTK